MIFFECFRCARLTDRMWQLLEARAAVDAANSDVVNVFAGPKRLTLPNFGRLSFYSCFAPVG